MIENKTIVQSTKWSAISEILAKLASPLANIILARLLVPEVFGLVASFMIVTTFAEVFTDSGFQKYIVQHDFKSKEQLHSYTTVAFWSNVLFSIAIWFVIFIWREPIAGFIGSPGYGIEVAVLSLLIPAHALSSIQISLYRREFRFKQLVPVRVIASLVPIFVTVPCALMLKNVWAIIIGNLAKELLTAALLTYNSTWKPRLFYKFSYLKDMFSDCMWLFGDSMMIWITAYSSVFIVNRFLDPYYTGVYQTGTTTIQPYLNLVFSVTSPVLFSALSRLQSNVEERNRVFRNYRKYASYIVVPMGVLVFVYRELVTTILLGSAWTEASLLVGCTGLVFPFNILIGQYNSVYFRAVGKANVAMGVQGIYNVIMIGIMLFAVNQPFAVLSVIGGSCSLAYCFISILALRIFLKIKIRSIIFDFLPAIISAFVAALTSYAMMPLFDKVIWWHIICVIIACVIYLVVLMYIPVSRRSIVNTAIFEKIKNKFIK